MQTNNRKNNTPDWRFWLASAAIITAGWVLALLASCTSTRRIETQTTRDTLRITR
ncbi:MAG: hypothetical protein HUK09_08095, partial [Bacteroidaceae bacterium]|nr:hypothetical protein [Bacteroidaceae bacterium]